MEGLTDRKVKNIIAELTATPIARKELIKKCLDKLNLPAEILKDRQPGAQLNKIKCQFGNAVTELLNSGILIQKDDMLQSRQDGNSDKTTVVANVKRDIEIEKIIYDILSEKQMDRKCLLAEVVRIFNSSDLDKNAVRGDAGRIIDGAVKNKALVKTGNLYGKPAENISDNETLEQKNKRLFKKISDEELVDKTILMLKEWYSFKGFKVKEALNTDGPQDNGIDGILKLVDGLEYTETILIQVKNLHNAERNVKLCEVREFGGVLAADKDATKGLFVTRDRKSVV